jgi:glycosyltransferase involved in cell wall biosynthesis
MKLAINLRTYFKGKIGGLENVVRNVCGGIAAAQHSALQPLTIFAHESEAANVATLFPYGQIIPVAEETAESVIYAELAHGNYDLLFCPLLVLDPLNAPVPSAIVMPDLQHEFYPEFFDRTVLEWRRRTYRASALRADVVFTLSEFSKKTIVERYGVGPEKIEVMALDADDEFRRPTPNWAVEAFLSLGLPRDYIFLPANFWPHKNHSNLLRAMQILARRYPELCLVLSGAPSTGVERIEKEIASLGLKNVRLVGYQKRAVLVEIYRRSRALVFVSKFEGFGIPLLEAFHTGTPAITSRTTSCPEVAGGAALLVNELDPASIAEGIERLLDDANLRQELVERGRLRAEEYSWKRTVDRTLARIASIPHRQARGVSVEENPVVSVVTPSYNMARFLEETIQSVLTQDYPRIDYIVMDGGSTDGTLEILKKYEGRLRYQSAPDRGQADAINKGFANAHGSIFAYLNADDTYLPGAVGKAVRHMVADPSTGVVYGEAYYVDEHGKVIDRYPTLPFDPKLLNSRCYICQPASFLWRDAFQCAGMMNVDQHVALDYDLWIRIAKMFPIRKIEDYLATSRMHRDNKTLTQRRKGYQEIVAITKTHYGYVPYEWINAYACYLIDGKDQFFDRSRPSLASMALGLAMGSYYNCRQLFRYWKDWEEAMGLGREFNGRWDDGWISKRYRSSRDVDGDASHLEIAGRHMAPIRGGLKLTIWLDGRIVASRKLVEHGPFQIAFELSTQPPGKRRLVEIESSRTFRPIVNGDYRRLSCVIDSVTFRNGGKHAC